MKTKIIVLSVITLLMSCGSKKEVGNGSSFTILKKEANGGFEQETNLLINNQKELASLYKQIYAGEAPTPDFTKKSVVAVFMGQKRTGGYAITITDVKVKSGTAYVTTLKTNPDGGMVTMALTEPYCIAEIPKVKNIDVK